MSDQPLLDGHDKTPVLRRAAEAHLPAPMPYLESPSMLTEDQGSGLLEYWHMLRRRKGTFLLIAFLGLLAAVLITLPQTPVYQARTTLEIQNLNENFLNMRAVSQTADEGAANPLGTDLQTQVNILQSESVLGQVIAKLDLGKKLPAADRKNVV